MCTGKSSLSFPVFSALPLAKTIYCLLKCASHAYISERMVAMTQLSPLKPRPRRILPAPVKNEDPHFSLRRSLALTAVLMLLTVCYCGPLSEDATIVAAAKRVLPIYSVARDDNVISVSFDASWGGDKTMAILDILDQYDAKATFYLVGIWVEKFPELVKEIADRGHEIGNHSATHAHMTQLSESKMRKELEDCTAMIEKITGKRTTLFRPPYGDYNSKVVTVCRDAGYEVVQWSVDSLDWKNYGVQDLITKATRNVQSGDIVLFHNDSQYIVEALPTILKYYKEQGLRMIPCGEILLKGPTTIDVQGKQHQAPATSAP